MHPFSKSHKCYLIGKQKKKTCLLFTQEQCKEKIFLLHHNNKPVGDNCIFLLQP